MDLLRKPFETEVGTGCRNLSVLGGFDRYVRHWLEEAGKKAQGAQLQELGKLRSCLQDYGLCTPSERRARLLTADRLLAAGAPKAEAQKENAAAPAAKTQAIKPSAQVQYLKGVGPKLALRLRALGIETVEDLLFHFPRRHEDRSNLKTVMLLEHGVTETVRVRIRSKTEQKLRKGLTLSKVIAEDHAGVLTLTWFNQPFAVKNLSPGQWIYATGKTEIKFGEIRMANPEIEPDSDGDSLHTARIIPVYPSTENLGQRTLRKIVHGALENCGVFPDAVPSFLREKYGFPPRTAAIRDMHFPENFGKLAAARNLLVYEELLLLQLRVLSLRLKRERIEKNRRYGTEEQVLENFEKSLPFRLTGAQKRVIREIGGDLASPEPMSRLLQGDVGSGKTLVAAAAVYLAVNSGYQACIMAPTEILAEQLYGKFLQFLQPLGFRAKLFTGSITGKKRTRLREELQTGEIRIAVGTHALIQEGVEFSRLGLAVIDEQHRFGVLQRTELQKKGEHPDLLVMTATPIPRTLSLTVYGDLKVSVIDELPPGRQKITSRFFRFGESGQVYRFIREEVKKGRQAYIVCSLIDESDKIEAKAALSQAQELQEGIFSDLKVGVLHGKMKAAEKEKIMGAFRLGLFDILISTTVIEVGVDVPNATVMAILNAERFGMAQLHQLRGRVGRGSEKSHCFFVGEPKSQEGMLRMKTMTESEDGFLIAEKDLEIRGPGEIYGTRQHGLPDLKVADLLQDLKLMETARKDARELLAAHPRQAAAMLGSRPGEPAARELIH